MVLSSVYLVVFSFKVVKETFAGLFRTFWSLDLVYTKVYLGLPLTKLSVIMLKRSIL